MKKIIFVGILTLALFAMPVSSSWEKSYTFLAAAISISDNDDATHGTEFTSRSIDIARINRPGALIIWFTPATPAAVDIEFEFAVSYDGVNFSTDDTVYEIYVPTNTRAVGGVVRVQWPLPFNGVRVVRLERVVVNSGAGNCSGINAAISF